MKALSFLLAAMLTTSALAVSEEVLEYQRVAAHTIMLSIVLFINLVFFFSLLILAGLLSKRRASALKDAKHFARRDPLTQLLNRRGFESAIAGKPKESGFLLIADIDDFKKINDTFGHAVGDIVLEKVARRLSGAIRNEDVIARLGGEEFIIFVSTKDNNELTEMAERLVQSVASAPFTLKSMASIDVTISLGAARIVHFDTDYAQAYQEADSNLYEAKKRGKDQAVISSRPCKGVEAGR